MTLQLRNRFLLSILILFFCGIVFAQNPTQETPPTKEAPTITPPVPASSSAELSAKDLDAFLDGVMPLQLKREDVAGAVVVIVKDGSILFSKGYGYADVAKKKPVSVEDTMFRPGSISKLFTWTSVMQLVEQGKLDLDKDINTYLDFKIPDTFPKPITLRNLMTHSPGFEETVKDLFTDKPEGIIPLGKYLSTHIPRRIFPPGETTAYSNYGTSVAGYIVERVSGQPLYKYIEKNIFEPLGMSHSSFEQPLPKNLAPLMSNGYKLGSGDPNPFEIVIAYPAGSLSSAGADMAKFMIAHLQDGQFENHSILKPETARLMHARTLAYDDAAHGMCLGFYEESRNGLRIFGHGGDTVYFHSDLHLIPEKNFGFFISYNSGGKGEIDARGAVWEKLLDRYFPYSAPAVKVMKDSKNNTAVAGTYILSRRSEGNFFRIPYLLLESKVVPDKDGSIQIPDLKDLNGQPKKWQEIRPFVFQEVDGQDLLVFKKMENPNRYRIIIPFPFFVYDAAPWYLNSKFVMTIVIFTIGIFLLTMILWPVAAITRRYYGKRLELEPSQSSFRRWAKIVATINLVILTAYALFIIQGFQSLGILTSKNDNIIRIFQVIAVFAGLGSLILILKAFRAFPNPGFWSKLYKLAVVLACIGFIWILIAGRFLDFSLRY
jgi:CubicO group peptidase (beta-lactamase class C family)